MKTRFNCTLCILALFCFLSPFVSSAQDKGATSYVFSSSGVRNSDLGLEFWGKSKERELRIKWYKDVWLATSNYRIDSISSEGSIEIIDNYKRKRYSLKIIPSGDSLSYAYSVDNYKDPNFSPDSNQWFKSLLETVIYPKLKAKFYDRIFRSSEELISVRVGSKFPYFDKVDINDHRITIEDLKNKITVINFWNIYCGPCIKEMPDLNRIARKYVDMDSYKFIAFSSSSGKEIERLFSKKKNIQFDYLQIPDAQEIEGALSLQFNPVSFILDGEGTIIYMEVGYTPENISNMEQILEKEGNRMQAKE